MSASASLLARLAGGDVDDEILAAVAAELERAGRPVSLPGLCNLLWFGRGPLSGYDGRAFSRYTDRDTYVTHEPDGGPDRGVQDAVPLGAIVVVRLGRDQAWGEVVWKEGAHPALGGGWVPGWLAGAPSGLPDDGPPGPDFVTGDGPVVLRERLVLDFDDCFGAGLSQRTRIERAKRRCDHLDRYGHVVARFAYPPGQDEADEVGFWAAWTAAHHPEALVVAGVAAEPAVLAEAASVLAAALVGRPEVRSFGPYYLAASCYERLIADDIAEDGPLGRSVRGLRHVPKYDQVAWASMSARLADNAGDAAGLEETGWATAVTSASLLALDVLATEAADGDWDGVHVRLDDLWQGGGLWRAELLDATTPVAGDPGLALGLGWVAYTGGSIDRRPTTDADNADSDEDDLEWSFDDSSLTWTTHLSRSDVDSDRLRVPARVAQLIEAHMASIGQDRLLVIVEHDGEASTQDWSPLADRCFAAEWPLGVWPGTTVRATWPLESAKITARTTLLGEPVDVAGLVYTHEFNEAVALAAAGLAPRSERTATIAQLVRAVVRRYGALLDDGRVGLPLDEVVAYCFGPDGQVAPGYRPAVLRASALQAVRAMAAAGIAGLDGDLVCVGDRHSRAGRAADEALLGRFAAAHAARLRREARKHYVPATVVNLGPGRHRSVEKDLGYDSVAGTERVPAGGLGPNQTWRAGHLRGNRIDPAVQAQLERTRQALRAIGGDETVTAELENALSDPGSDPLSGRRT